jgi:membrane associated rhomboid family serine protease
MKFKFYALWLCLVCIAVFLVQLIIPGFTELFVLNENAYSEPWRFFTAIFLHSGLMHLAYNLFALALFGSILEKFIGGKRFLAVFLVSGLLANVFSGFFYDSALGASGAIFGVIGALIVVRPMLVVWAFGLPMPIFVAGIIWVGGDLIGAYGYLIGSPLDNTGNIAHLAGIFVGLVFGLFFRNWREKKVNEKRMIIDENSVRGWEDYYLK